MPHHVLPASSPRPARLTKPLINRDNSTLSTALALAAAAIAGTRIPLPGGLNVGAIAALVLAPLWWIALRHFRFARAIFALGFTAIAWGVVVSLTDSAREVDPTLARTQVFTVLAFVGSIGILLWSIRHAGKARTAIAFGSGALLDVALTGSNPENLWKYSFALPVTIIVLGLAHYYRSRSAELLGLASLALMSLLSDSRSMTAFLLLAAVITLWQAITGPNGRQPRPWRAVLLLVTLGGAIFALVQALILDGLFGDAAQQRSQAQLDATGSLITGGRPELGAARALIAQQPWGYGIGTTPLSHDVWIAKTGMSELNYDPNNGYVEQYMFGGHYEVHSVLGDLWITFGPPAAVLILMLLVVAGYATARAVSTRTASALVVLLIALGMWDTFFSPLLTSYSTLALLVAISAIPAKTTTAELR